jgi:hypothetical protein
MKNVIYKVILVSVLFVGCKLFDYELNAGISKQQSRQI